jgi:YihY family inner membrane protein
MLSAPGRPPSLAAIMLRDALAAVDGFQQRHGPLSLLVGVLKKFGDDRAGSLAALIAYYGFISMFPLLLVFVTVLDLVLTGNPHLRHQLQTSALSGFPVIGEQIKVNPRSVEAGSVVGLVVGLLLLLWGALAVAQAAQHAMAEVWDVAATERPGFLARLARSNALFGVLMVSVVVTTGLAGLSTYGGGPAAARVGSGVASAVANVALYLLGFAVLTPGEARVRQLWPGAVVAGVTWTALQLLGGYLVGHQLRHSSAAYGTFGVVLGLLWWLYLAAQMTLYSAELNVVLARRLWPRSLSSDRPTEADLRARAARPGGLSG